MKQSFAHFIRTNRNALAVAMLCVLVLKGFSFLGMASSMAKYPEASNQYFSAAVLGAHCDQDRDAGLPQGTPHTMLAAAFFAQARLATKLLRMAQCWALSSPC
jgi:hypothetical protein